jgi:hypothetical protein
MRYSGNWMADSYERRFLIGRKCEHCSGKGVVYPSDENELKEELRLMKANASSFVKFSFSDFLAIWRDWRKTGKIDCPCCEDGRVYE